LKQQEIKMANPQDAPKTKKRKKTKAMVITDSTPLLTSTTEQAGCAFIDLDENSNWQQAEALMVYTQLRKWDDTRLAHVQTTTSVDYGPIESLDTKLVIKSGPVTLLMQNRLQLEQDGFFVPLLPDIAIANMNRIVRRLARTEPERLISSLGPGLYRRISWISSVIQ
jgi:hypothetical protein